MTPTKGGYTSHKEANTSFRITLIHGIATFNSEKVTTHPDKVTLQLGMVTIHGWHLTLRPKHTCTNLRSRTTQPFFNFYILFWKRMIIWSIFKGVLDPKDAKLCVGVRCWRYGLKIVKLHTKGWQWYTTCNSLRDFPCQPFTLWW